MSFALFSSILRAARKNHVCIWCGQIIPVGSKYIDERSVYDGRIQRHRWHQECDVASDEYFRFQTDFTPYENERPNYGGMIEKMSERPYRNLGRRVLASNCGWLGTIVAAKRRKENKRGWSITVEWDQQPDASHVSAFTERELGTLFHLVSDDFRHDLRPIQERLRLCAEWLEQRSIDVRHMHITEFRIGRDKISAWKPPMCPYEITVDLWGEMKSYRAESEDKAECVKKLVGILRDEADALERGK